jgi:hypothetical protein
MFLANAGPSCPSGTPLVPESMTSSNVGSEPIAGQETAHSLLVDVPSISCQHVEERPGDTVLNDEELALQMPAHEARIHTIVEGDRALARVLQQQERTADRLAGFERL